MDLEAFGLTLRLALSTTATLLLVALPLAWWIAAGKGWGRALVQAVVALPLVLPPTVIGFYLLVALGPLTAPGRMLIRVLGHPLAFSFAGLLAGSIIYSLPFAVQPLVAGFSGVDRGYIEAAAGLGARPGKVFLTVVLPMARASLLTSAVLTFTHTVGEFGVVLMLGGNIPGATRTLSISLYDLVQDGNYGAANQTALVLVGFSVVALMAVYLLPGVRKLDGRRADVVR
jgi:molybdate transport system permease protein